MTPRWQVPTTLEQALDLLGDDQDAVLVAGGVSVVLFMNVGFLHPTTMVSLAALPELFGVQRTAAEIDIGALETHTRLAADPILRAAYPAASTMFAGIANARVRNWGTVGGNLAHADPAQDPPVLLAALGASVDVAGPAGVRSVPVAQLADGPLMPAIGDDEIITRVRIPVAGDQPPRTAYMKFLPGTKDDYATVSIGAALRPAADGTVTDVHLTAGSVGPVVIALDVAAQRLEGQTPDPDVLASVGAAVRDEVRPSSDRRGSADYKREMAGVMAQRAIRECLAADPGDVTANRGATT